MPHVTNGNMYAAVMLAGKAVGLILGGTVLPAGPLGFYHHRKAGLMA
jgi:hypothetical protein